MGDVKPRDIKLCDVTAVTSRDTRVPWLSPTTTTMAPAVSSQMTLKRIHREIADVAKEDLGPITLGPTSDNLFVWKGSLPGPQGSPYEGGVFDVDVVLGNDYPYVIFFTMSPVLERDGVDGLLGSQHRK
jgi:hypothetical protein